MIKTIAAASALCLLVVPVQAQQSFPAPVAQIAMLPLPATGRDDVTDLVKKHYSAYFQTEHPERFGRESVRIGRYDFDDDGRAELVVMAVSPHLQSSLGYPVGLAHWTDAGWEALGWSWGDPDTIFAIDEVIEGRRSLDTGTQLLRWDRGLYSRVDKNPR